MTTYKISTDKTAFGKQGDSVSADDLAGLNVDALVAAGHLEPVIISSKKEKKEQD